jgi:ADP-dependent phosphofructokinase/glucokinase
MCHGHRRHGFRRFGNREQWLERLEAYQRDLEQELADVADLVRRLKEGQPQETATV